MRTTFAVAMVPFCLMTAPSVCAEEEPESTAQGVASANFVRRELAAKASPDDIALAVSMLIPASQKGTADGVATLGADGKVPNEQLPAVSYNDLTDTPTVIASESDPLAVKLTSVTTTKPTGENTDAEVPSTKSVYAALGDYLPTGGGTMTGAIVLSGAPSADLHPATKKYVDDIAAQNSGMVPSWGALAGQDWDTTHWGEIWEVDNGANKITGAVACLATDEKSGNIPSATAIGRHCWYRVSAVNDTRVAGRVGVYFHLRC
jgi:hypothetical protein